MMKLWVKWINRLRQLKGYATVLISRKYQAQQWKISKKTRKWRCRPAQKCLMRQLAILRTGRRSSAAIQSMYPISNMMLGMWYVHSNYFPNYFYPLLVQHSCIPAVFESLVDQAVQLLAKRFVRKCFHAQLADPTLSCRTWVRCETFWCISIHNEFCHIRGFPHPSLIKPPLKS